MVENELRLVMRGKAELAVALLLLALSFFSSIYLVSGAPQGATLSFIGLDSGPNRTPANSTQPGGRIITVNLNLEQQNGGWKAYLGNVTGLYVLQNANNQSIYEWTLSLVQGEVYISRNQTVNFSGVACADTAIINSENTFFGFAGSDDDAINKTFNSTLHRAFSVGTVPIAISTCPATALWVNDTVQAQSTSAVWQEVLLDDGANLVYTSLMNNDRSGFDNKTYDFQAIIADNRSSSSGANYYFYVELG